MATPVPAATSVVVAGSVSVPCGGPLVKNRSAWPHGWTVRLIFVPVPKYGSAGTSAASTRTAMPAVTCCEYSGRTPTRVSWSVGFRRTNMQRGSVHGKPTPTVGVTLDSVVTGPLATPSGTTTTRNSRLPARPPRSTVPYTGAPAPLGNATRVLCAGERSKPCPNTCTLAPGTDRFWITSSGAGNTRNLIELDPAAVRTVSGPLPARSGTFTVRTPRPVDGSTRAPMIGAACGAPRSVR